MAFTQTLTKTTVFGNQRVSEYFVTADAASGSVVTNIGVIDSVAVTPCSLTTAIFKVKINTSAASAAANGSILISSVASGDTMFVVVYGH